MDRPLPNPALHAAIAAGIAIQVGLSTVPGVARLLGTDTFPGELWALVGATAGVSWALATVWARAPGTPGRAQRAGDEPRRSPADGAGGVR